MSRYFPPYIMSVNYIRLFDEGRLDPTVPEHHNIIEATLAGLQITDEHKYNKYRKLYDDKIVKDVVEELEEIEEVAEEVEPEVEEAEEEVAEEEAEEKPKKKPGRPKKTDK